jgi:hypothetical protein
MLALRHFLFAGAFLTGASLMSSAHAGSVVGSQSLGVYSLNANSTNLGSVTEFTLTQFTGTGGLFQTGDFIGLSTQTLDPSVLNTASLNTFSFGSSDFGWFQAESGTELASPTNTRTFYLVGTFHAGSDALFSGKTDISSGSVLVNLTQAGGPGNSISWSATLTVPAISAPVAVPEPTGLAMAFIPSLLGLMAWRRRVKASA